MTGYDSGARRDTPLARKLKQRIRREGPIGVAEYMRACLGDSEHGYYVTRPAIGAKGDFVTAPEISQVFGELVGLWCAVVWQQMGAPARFALIELGPGRGTLMRDALRAARVVPGFLDASQVRLVEINPTLRAQQHSALRDSPGLASPPRWYENVEQIGVDEPDVHALPTIVIGNEFLDTFAPSQIVRRGDGWTWRTIALDEADHLVFSDSRETMPTDAHPSLGEYLDRCFPQAREGDIASLTAFGYVPRVLLAGRTVAALFIDYGSTEPIGADTLQAVRNHAYEHPLTSPGEADLTVQVDFAELVRATESADCGLAIDGPVTQAEFLGALGIMERASRLMAANPSRAGEIEAGIARLMAVPGMGSRFKAIGVRSCGLPPLPGFPVDRRRHEA